MTAMTSRCRERRPWTWAAGAGCCLRCAAAAPRPGSAPRPPPSSMALYLTGDRGSGPLGAVIGAAWGRGDGRGRERRERRSGAWSRATGPTDTGHRVLRRDCRWVRGLWRRRAHSPILCSLDLAAVPAAEEVLGRGLRFNLVCSLEVVEHVPDARAFVSTLAGLTAVGCRAASRAAARCAPLPPRLIWHVAAAQPGGVVVLSTLNRTAVSKVLAIGLAEYVLGLVPVGACAAGARPQALPLP